jgi:hypothetical protein
VTENRGPDSANIEGGGPVVPDHSSRFCERLISHWKDGGPVVPDHHRTTPDQGSGPVVPHPIGGTTGTTLTSEGDQSRV